jgi:ferrochelatase
MAYKNGKTRSYDAVVVLSFGGPEGPEDVLPFLHNVIRGRKVPQSRFIEVAEHYQAFDGISPIDGQNREFARHLSAELERRGFDLPVMFGNRN